MHRSGWPVFGVLTLFAAIPARPQARALERADLEAWLDGGLPGAMRAGGIAGGVVVVVKDGSVLLAKGYGVADVATGRTVDPDRTLFRPGSISKLFTAVAVMQLVQSGRLDLDRDVNRDLDFPIPPRFGRPVTLRDLLRHTAGFDETIRDLVFFDSTRIEPLARYVRRHLPARVYPPGMVPAYSNYGMSLAGYLVQRASGEEFEGYVERRVFAPLGMRGASFRQPLPGSLRPLLSTGYRTAREPIPFEIFGPRPAGGMSVTGADMARFMIAALDPDSGSRILSPASWATMEAHPSTALARVNGVALGFLEYDRGGRRIIGHDGGAPAFRSNLRLLVRERVGLFVSFNSIGEQGAVFPLRESLIDGFLDRYFPDSSAAGPTVPTARRDAELAAGWYQASGQSRSTFMSLFSADQTEVVANEDGTIGLSTLVDPSGRPKRWREVGPWLWQEVDGLDRLEMGLERNRVAMIRRSGDQAGALLPVPFWRRSSWNVPLVGITIITLVAAFAGGPIHRRIRRHYGWGPVPRAIRVVPPATSIVLGLDLMFASGWVAILVALANGRVDWFGRQLDP
jgi:CubicO group peptidase (beta-lactamase class C family)